MSLQKSIRCIINGSELKMNLLYSNLYNIVHTFVINHTQFFEKLNYNCV